MVPYLGYFALWIALISVIMQFIISFKKDSNKIINYHNLSALTLVFGTVFSFLALTYSYIISDFSVLNVFQNSHTTKPLLYKIAGVWGNHEGSMLLWIVVLSIINYFIYKFYNNENVELISKTLRIQSVIIFGFLIFVIATSNPFERIPFTNGDGLGFNPILQDPALAIHPPLLYFGYVGFSATFSISVAIMLMQNINLASFRYIKIFAISSWIFLTIGIAIGSIWAYYELGWGGWWFWDPVENAALMPWILGTALLHSTINVEKRQTLQTWVLILSILTFLLSVIGTFLVRSGILTSVHTFALDPARGIYILSFVAILGVYSLTLFSLKAKHFRNTNYFSLFNKEGSIFINNLFMIIVCVSIFFGTTYPLFVEIFSNKRISIGEPYYNSTAIPIFMPAIIIMGIVPLLSWGKLNLKKVAKETLASLILTILSAVFFIYFFYSFNIIGFVGIILSFWIISNLLINFLFNLKIKDNSKLNFIKNFNAMKIAHFGVALLILGITASSIWQEENIIRMKINDTTTINNYKIVLKEINEFKGPNYLGIEGNFYVFNKNKHLITNLKPQNRIYLATSNTTSEVSIHTNLIRDLYIVLGDNDLNNGWVVRIYYNPLVIWIWIGVGIISLGGIIALINNFKILIIRN